MTTETFALKVARTEAIGDRIVDLSSRLATYDRLGANVGFAESDVLSTPWRTSPPPELVVRGTSKLHRAANDVDNAITLHTWLKGVLTTRRTQRDNRFWTWLAHNVFADYCRKRWAPPPNASEEKRTNSVRSHWFLRGEGRGAVGDHALARLFWGVEAVTNPGEVDPYFEQQDRADAHCYPRILLGYQNVHLQIRDRTFGTSRVILFSALEALRQIGQQGGPIDPAAAVLGREINLIGRYRNLDGLRPRVLVPLFVELATGDRVGQASKSL